MNTFAAVITAKGTGAIATIQVFGSSSKAIIKKIFKPTGKKPADFKPGKILLGAISNGSETIDQVTIGCESPNSFAIHCHGNPLIVEMIMQLLARHGAIPLTAEEFLAKVLSCEKHINTIELESKLAQPKALTLEGTKIIANQIDAGLSGKAQEWSKNINKISLNEIKTEASEILKNSKTAKLIIAGCTAAIIGPPNTGKSTLLNCLCGRQKAIVTAIAGTTRDWVSARCQIGPLSVELFDTAGLDEKLTLTSEDTIEKASQQKSIEILDKADLILLVLDNSLTADQLDKKLLEKIAGKLVLTVLNKSDLPEKFDLRRLPKMLTNKVPSGMAYAIKISAKFGIGIEHLLKKIQQLLNVTDYNLKKIACFTHRQENLLKQLKKAKSKGQTTQIITELLNGQLSV
jgi:tRNA modification GTPase